MEDPTLIVAAAGPLTGALFIIGSLLRNRKKNNPGSLHDVHLTLTRIETKLDALERIENKVDKLGGL